MAFMHDTDFAEARWKKAQWRNYELWEKKENRAKRKQLAFLFGTIVFAILISVVPVMMEFMPRWQARALTRKLADELVSLKTASALEHMAYRFRFIGDGSLSYRIERARDCDSREVEVVREGNLGGGGKFRLISRAEGEKAQVFIPGLTHEFCYDSLLGSDPRMILDNMPVGFAIVYVNDLTEYRTDRSSILLISGRSANISFN